jgi:protoporphyrin/coproporphyrin ferrochelatase
MNSDGRSGVLLMNVGTPEAPRTPEVRRYLREFLGDPRVLDTSAPSRWLLLNLVILPFRPAKSAEAYRAVWGVEGSPLLVHARALASALQSSLGGAFDVEVGMRYGSPSIATGLEALRARGADRIVLFPLYPQYASSTTGTSLAEAYRLAARLWNVPFLTAVPPFYEDPGLIGAFASTGRPVLDEVRPEHVLFSFHGLPETQIRKSDESGSHCLVAEDCCARIRAANRNCYRAQCFRTAGAIAASVGLPDGAWSVAFQSRLGRTPWIRPYTDERVRELAQEGTKRLVVFSPAFVADCLETLEEIGMRAKEEFLAHGGEAFALVPSLNEHPAWVDAAAELVRRASGR